MAEHRRKANNTGKGWLVTGGVCAGLAAAYLGSCAWVGASDRTLPNVYVAGVNLSNLSQSEAVNTLQRSLAPETLENRDTLVEVWYEDFTGHMSADAFETDFQAAAQRAQKAGREFFPLNTIQYIRSLTGTVRDLDLQDVTLTSTGEDELDQLVIQANEELGVDDYAAGYTIDWNTETLNITKGYTHRAVDKDATRESIKEAYPSRIKGVWKTVQMTVNEQPPENPDFQQIHDDVYAEAQEPTYDPSTGQVSDHVVGVDFDPALAESLYATAKEGETIQVPLTITQPKDTKTSYQNKLFSNLLGEATSRVSGSANRKSNVKISANACSGVILMPGEVFSYNTSVTTRNASEYLSAPVYKNGKTEYEVGGGLCQASSTLYLAVLHTTLDIVERYNHTYATGYVPDGMDATIYFGSKDFRFRNNTNYPIKVVAENYDSSGSRYLTMKLYGTNESGRYAVPTSDVYDWIQPTTSYVADSSIPRGTTKVDTQQNAYTGRKARTYRTIFEADGTKVETENLGVSSYKMRPTTIYYNPQDGDPSTWTNGVPPKATSTTPSTPSTPSTGNESENQGSSVLPDTPKEPDTTTDTTTDNTTTTPPESSSDSPSQEPSNSTTESGTSTEPESSGIETPVISEDAESQPSETE